MLIQIVYPTESYFFPYHVIIAIITTVIFVLVVLSYRQYIIVNDDWIRAQEKRGQKPKKPGRSDGATPGPTDQYMSSTDLISLVGLIGTVIFSGIYPFLLSPTLDYNVQQEEANTFKVVINNYGMFSAKNAILSVTADSATFTHVVSQPPLLTSSNPTDQTERGIFKFDVLPPASKTTVTFQQESGQINALTPYLRSDEKVGYHDTIITTIFYLVLAATYVIFFLHIFYWEKLRGEQSARTLGELRYYSRNFIFPYLGVITLWEILFSLYYYFSNHPGDDAYSAAFPILVVGYASILGLVLRVRNRPQSRLKNSSAAPQPSIGSESVAHEKDHHNMEMGVEGKDSDAGCLVWYAVYGSNLLKDRFKCYLEGRRFRKLTTNGHVPKSCDGETNILDDHRFKLEFKLYFARDSPDWGGGGVAFVGTQRETPAPTYGRAYLLTLRQLIHVANEENGGGDERRIKIDEKKLQDIRAGTQMAPINIIDEGWYRYLLPCGNKPDGRPVVTLTGRPEETDQGKPPSRTYLETMREGLREIESLPPLETYPNMKDADIDIYIKAALSNKPPVSGASANPA